MLKQGALRHFTYMNIKRLVGLSNLLVNNLVSQGKVRPPPQAEAHPRIMHSQSFFPAYVCMLQAVLYHVARITQILILIKPTPIPEKKYI